MKKQIIHLLLVLGLVITGGLQYGLNAQSTYESAQSGNFSVGSTWVGGQAPPDYQHILIKSGHTVTLDRGTDWNDYILVWNITIEEGAVLNNNGWPLWIRTPTTSTPQYKNDGTHNGPGTMQSYQDGDMRIDGNGFTNLDVEYYLQGRLEVRYTCNLTINGDIKPTQYGYAGPNVATPRIKYEIFEGVGGTLTVNGDVYSVGNIVTNNPVNILIPTEGTLIVNGNIYFNAAADVITNDGTFTVTGNLTLGTTTSSYFWNRNQGHAEIGGDVLGGGSCFLRHGHDAHIKFGAQVFPDGFGGTLQFIQPSNLNIVEYNGTTSQIIRTFNLPFRNLTINNSSSEGVTLTEDIAVDGTLSLINGHVHLAGNNLLLGNEATIGGSPSVSGMIIATGSGELRKTFSTPTTFTFPVGNAGDQPAYSPVTLDFASGTFNDDYVGVNLNNIAYPGAGTNHVKRYWNLSSSGVAAFNSNLSFQYTEADVVGDEEQIYCYRVEPNEEIFDPANTTLHVLTASNVADFGTFTGKTQPNPNAPLVYNITGGGAYCEGDPGIEVGLDNSETDAFYTLYKNNVPVITDVQGTGAALSFGFQNQGIYTASGTNVNGTIMMNGHAVVLENTLYTPDVVITTASTSVCQGTEVSIIAVAQGSGPDPLFEWFLNGEPAGENSQFFYFIPQHLDEIQVKLTSSASCTTVDTVWSNVLVMNVSPLLEAEVFIEIDNEHICDGELVVLTALSINQGDNPTYQWFVNGFVQGTTAPQFSYFPENNDEVYVELTSSEICIAEPTVGSDVYVLPVFDIEEMQVSITGETEACEGEEVTIASEVVNGGENPVYQWYLNSVETGENVPDFSFFPSDGDQVQLLVNSSSDVCVFEPLVYSNILTIQVLSSITPAAVIASQPDQVCQGEVMTITAATSGGGSSPQYQWMVNGIDVGDNSPVFAYMPDNGDLVQLAFYSSSPCATEVPVHSNIISAIVNDLPEVSWLAFESDTLCVFWEPVPLFGGLPEGGTYSGPGVNNNTFDPGVAGSGTHILTYSYTSADNCTNQAQFDVFVDYCTGVADNGISGQVTVYPNPAKTEINIAFDGLKVVCLYIRLYNSSGIQVFQADDINENIYKIDLSKFPAGVYLIALGFEHSVINKQIVVFK